MCKSLITSINSWTSGEVILFCQIALIALATLEAAPPRKSISSQFARARIWTEKYRWKQVIRLNQSPYVTYFQPNHFFLSTHTYIQLTKMNITPLAVYRSKMAFFKRAWQKVKVLSRPWALGFKSEMIRPLKWGTLGLRTPGGFKNTSRQSWKNKT